MKVLETLVAVKNIKGTSFVGVRNYENKSGEISNQTFLVGISYPNLLANDLEKLKSNEVLSYVGTLSNEYDETLVNKAYNELVASLEKRTASEAEKDKLRALNDSTIKRSDAQINAFTNLAKGLKTKDNALHIYGLCIRKTVLKKGEYKSTKSYDKTIIKNKITKFADLRGGKFKSFKLGNLETLKLQGLKI